MSEKVVIMIKKFYRVEFLGFQENFRGFVDDFKLEKCNMDEKT